MKEYFQFFLFLGFIISINPWSVDGQSMMSICKTAYSIDDDNVIASTSDGEVAVLSGPEDSYYSIYAVVEDSNGEKAGVFMLAGGVNNLRSYYGSIRDHRLSEYGSGCLLSSADLYMLVIKPESENGKIKLRFFDSNDNYIGATRGFSWEELEEVFEISMKSIEGELLTEETSDGKKLLLFNSEGINTTPYFALDITGRTEEIFSSAFNRIDESIFGENKKFSERIGIFKDQISGKDYSVSVVGEEESYRFEFRNIDDIFLSDNFYTTDYLYYLFR